MPSPKKRARNTATQEQLHKVLKSELDSLDSRDFHGLNGEQLVANYKDLLLAILPLTLRPPQAMLEQAVAKIFPKTDDTTCRRWAKAICEAVQFVRSKSQKFTSGKKLTPAVLQVAKLYLRQCRKSDFSLKDAGNFAQSSGKKRKLKREVSNASSAVLPVAGTVAEQKLSILETMPKLASDRPAVPVEISSGSESGQPVEAASSKPAVSGSYWVDDSKMVLARLKNGELEEARMSKGPAGFAIARFGEEAAIETEIPNTLLFSPKSKAGSQKKPATCLMKRPAADACLKKPASAPVEEESSDASANILSPPPVMLEPMDAPERLYRIEDYKVTASRKTATLALRRQFGDKKQFVSFSLKSIPRETGLKIIQEALSKLHNGMTEDKCKDWLAKQHRCLSASDVD